MRTFPELSLEKCTGTKNTAVLQETLGKTLKVERARRSYPSAKKNKILFQGNVRPVNDGRQGLNIVKNLLGSRH